MLVITESQPVGLNDALREAHEGMAESIAKEIASRKAKGIPLDDDTDFAKLRQCAGRIGDACAQMDGAKALEEVQMAAAMCNGGLRELEPFVPVDDYADLVVTFRSVSEGERVRTREELVAASNGQARHAVFLRYLGLAITKIEGLEDAAGPVMLGGRDGQGLNKEEVRLLDVLGLVSDLWAAARHWAELPPSKKKAFGSRQPSTSATSTAAAAAPSDEPSSGATAELPTPFTDSPTTSQTPVPAA